MICPSGGDGFNATCQFTAGNQHPAPTLEAFQANVCTQPHYFPLKAAAGVYFSQPQLVIHL
jgi:hypothetical protein